jgi:hypothetical protein
MYFVQSVMAISRLAFLSLKYQMLNLTLMGVKSAQIYMVPKVSGILNALPGALFFNLSMHVKSCHELIFQNLHTLVIAT